MTAKWPTALVVVIVLCLLRGLVGLCHISTLFRYFLQERYPAFGMFQVYLTETLRLLFSVFGFRGVPPRPGWRQFPVRIRYFPVEL